MPVDISAYVEQLTGKLDETAYKASDALGRIGTEAVVEKMIQLLKHQYPESRIMAARTLGLVKNNQPALIPIIEAVKDKENGAIAGDLLMSLEGFDVSALYVEMFRFYLFGTFKVSTVAKGYLDFEEFDITPRVIKKTEKHWNHYSNNVKHDDLYELRRIEVEEMLNDLKAYVEQQ